MKKRLRIIELEDYLEDLLDSQALEIVHLESSNQILIPYMMNDSVECYIEFIQSQMKGNWNNFDQNNMVFDILIKEDNIQLSFTQNGNPSFDIIFQNADLILNCYQYHRIGHNWRRKKGQEQWRRLVNILCVLHDKYTYLGNDFCNELEVNLHLLMEFAPLCYWTPINDSIQSWYPETEVGIRKMISFSKEAGDTDYAEMTEKYLEEILSGRGNEISIYQMAKELLKPEHRKIYDYLLKKIEQASLQWPPRFYKNESEHQILRKEKEIYFKNLGFKGQYPLLWKKDSTTNTKKEILFVEEHPFTIMESDDYMFRIYEVFQDFSSDF